jgi:hypothetical protein
MINAVGIATIQVIAKPISWELRRWDLPFTLGGDLD